MKGYWLIIAILALKACSAAGDYPEIRFTNLEEGSRVAAGTGLRVEAEATDGNGIREVKLYMNGLVLIPDRTAGNIYSWSSTSDELLRNPEQGYCHLEVVAEDLNGLRSSKKIGITVGIAAEKGDDDWQDQVYQVILSEGEMLMDGESLEFPCLECFLTVDEEGSLALFGGSPQNREGVLWKTRGKADRPTPQPAPVHFYAIMEKGRLTVYRGTPGNPDVILWQSGNTDGPGPYRLGITAARRLVLFNPEAGRDQVAWMSDNR